MSGSEEPTRPARRIFRSFGYAVEGLFVVIRTQPNFAVHLAAAAAALAMCALLRLPPSEVALVVLTICVVLAAEAFNTAVEALSDRVSADFDPLIKRAKDTAAAGVLIAALGAIGVGIAVFGPPLMALLSGLIGLGR